MTRSAELVDRDAKLAELKRLITSHRYETLENLEDAVDALLWGDAEELVEQLPLSAQAPVTA